jgi:hypothetical protein
MNDQFIYKHILMMSRVELDIRLANINVVGKFSPTTDNLIFSSIY